MPSRKWLPVLSVLAILAAPITASAFHPKHHVVTTTTTGFVTAAPAMVHVTGVTTLAAPVVVTGVSTLAAPTYFGGVSTLAAPGYFGGVNTLSAPAFLNTPLATTGVTTLSAPETEIATTTHVSGNTVFTFHHTSLGRTIVTSAPITGNPAPPDGGTLPTPKASNGIEAKLDAIIKSTAAMQQDISAIRKAVETPAKVSAPATPPLLIDAINSIKSDVAALSSLKNDIGSIKADIANLKKDVEALKNKK